MPAIVVYISGHGFGHASRSIEVINALVDRRPNLDVIVRSSVAPWLVTLTARAGVGLEAAECDTGVVQIDSLHLNEAESIRRARAFMATFPSRLEIEAAWLNTVGASLIVADIPPLGIAAGHAAGLPAIALGNFTWDWIYSAYAGSQDLVTAIGEIYANTTLALRLPMCGGFATMPRIRDLPFVARRSRRNPQDVRAALGLNRDARLVLVSFGGHGTDRIDLDALATLERFTAVIAGPSDRCVRGSLVTLDERDLYATGYRYEDLVSAVDVVVSKPGYGIIAECIANQTALLYTSRGHFIEYEALVAQIPRYLRSGFIGHADLFAGRWEPHLERILSQPPPPEQAQVNGADIAADAILQIL